MKDYVNPMLLAVVLVLMACSLVAEADETIEVLQLSVLTLCATGALVDGTLGLARALSRRASVGCVVWGGVFFVLGCVAWALSSMSFEASEEQQAYKELRREQPQNPLQRDAEGENVFTRAAALGDVRVVQDVLNHANPSMDDINEAALRAVEGNRLKALEALARRGVTAGTVVDGTPLLCAAAQNGACEVMEWLLNRGAEPNARDAEGVTPLIHATLAGSERAVKLLLAYGADPQLKDTTGTGPQDVARDAALKDILTGKQKQ